MKIAAVALVVLAVLGLVMWMLRRREEALAAAPPRPKFRAGQVWIYKTRPTETDSRLTILKVQRLGNKNIVHIHVAGVSIKNAAAPSGTSTFISHMPFAEQAVEESVVRLVSKSGRLPPFEVGLAKWKHAAARGKAGVFTVGVAEAIDGIETAFQKHPRPDFGDRWSEQTG